MPKSKKAKTSHAGNFNGIKADRNLTHDEIWDDSALLRSWEAAVEEYKVRLAPDAKPSALRSEGWSRAEHLMLGNATNV